MRELETMIGIKFTAEEKKFIRQYIGEQIAQEIRQMDFVAYQQDYELVNKVIMKAVQIAKG